jgi:hypothetical protein
MSLQFGIADFGRCLLRRYSDPASNSQFIPEYIENSIKKYELFAFYKQIPLEARLLNFCLKRNLDDADPAYLVSEWLKDEDVIQQSYLNDIIASTARYYMGHFFKKPLFIAMVELLQSISAKIRVEPLVQALQLPLPQVLPALVLSTDESIAMEFIITRYMAVSPFVTICEQMLNLLPDNIVSN